MIGQIKEARDNSTAFETLSRLLDGFGIDYYGFGSIVGAGDRPTNTLEICHPTFRRITADYQQRELFRNDPGIRLLRQGGSELIASKFYLTRQGSSLDPAAQVAEMMRAADVQEHICVPILPIRRGVTGYFALGALGETPALELRNTYNRNRTLIYLAALSYLDVHLRDSGKRDGGLLTRSEVDVLTELARGAAPAEVARARGKSIHTVRQQIASARKRLGARSVAEAVLLARELGEIRLG